MLFTWTRRLFSSGIIWKTKPFEPAMFSAFLLLSAVLKTHLGRTNFNSMCPKKIFCGKTFPHLIQKNTHLQFKITHWDSLTLIIKEEKVGFTSKLIFWASWKLFPKQRDGSFIIIGSDQSFSFLMNKNDFCE